MSAFKSLIESGGECGTTNPVVELARQLTTAASVQQPTTMGGNFDNGSITDDSLLRNEDGPSFNMSSMLSMMEMEMRLEANKQENNNQGLMQSFNDETNKMITANEDLWSGAFNDSNNFFTSVAEEDTTWANDFVANLASSSNQEVEPDLGALAVQDMANFKQESHFDMPPPPPIEQALPAPSFFQNIFGSEQSKVSLIGADQKQELNVADTEQNIGQMDKESTFLETQFDDVEFWSNLAEDFNIKTFPTFAESYMQEFKDKLYQPLEELKNEASSSTYRYQKENVFDREEDRTKENEFDRLMKEGINRLAKGEVAASILLFEAALKIRDDVANAWRMLGVAQAKNENDLQSIAAMKRCLALDPDNLDALMHLGISYTNESNVPMACYALYEYLLKHPKHGAKVAETPFKPNTITKTQSQQYSGPGPIPKRWQEQTTMAPETNVFSNGFFEYILSNYQAAAEKGEETGDQKADIHCGLGVLQNLSGDFQRAIENFRLALVERPFDHLLWNRLGATLSNSGNSDEAIKAYREALARYPGYIRARYNLGISCILLDAPNEAIQHLLTVLNMQAAGRELIGLAPDDANEISRSQITSNNVWSTLRNAIMNIHRSDLYETINRRDLKKLNEEFKFVLPKAEVDGANKKD